MGTFPERDTGPVRRPDNRLPSHPPVTVMDEHCEEHRWGGLESDVLHELGQSVGEVAEFIPTLVRYAGEDGSG